MCGFFALADQFTLELEPGAFLVHHAALDAHVQNAAFLVNAVIIQDVELGLGKRRGDLVLNDFDLHMIAHGVAGGIFDRFLAANIQAHAGVEFQRLAARGGFRVTEHDPDFFPDLVGKHAGGFGFGQNGGQLAQGLAHKPRLHPHRSHTHLAFQFGLGHQGGHGINHDHIQRVGARQCLANSQRLFATVGLGHQQIVQVHSQAFGVGGIQRVLGVNERGQSARSLRMRDDVEHQSGFAGGFRAKNFDNTPARHAADSQGQIERERACGDDRDLLQRSRIAQPHDAAIAIGLGDG